MRIIKLGRTKIRCTCGKWNPSEPKNRKKRCAKCGALLWMEINDDATVTPWAQLSGKTVSKRMRAAPKLKFYESKKR